MFKTLTFIDFIADPDFANYRLSSNMIIPCGFCSNKMFYKDALFLIIPKGTTFKNNTKTKESMLLAYGTLCSENCVNLYLLKY